MSFEYFYAGDENDFIFYRLPKRLIREPCFDGLSYGAKLLYGCMLDRQGLSEKNGWRDRLGRVYIFFTIEDICEELRCSRKKASAMLNELEFKGGLIQRIRQGQGKPNRIYVRRFRNFFYPQEASDGSYKNTPTEASKSFQRILPEASNGSPNNTEINKTEMNENPSFFPEEGRNEEIAIRRYLEEQCCFEYLKQDYPYKTSELDSIRELMVEVCTSTAGTIRVNGEDKPTGIVRSRFLKLNSEHIRYVMDCLKENTTKVTFTRSYLLTVLYNAPTTIDHYYTALVNYDMAHPKE